MSHDDTTQPPQAQVRLLVNQHGLISGVRFTSNTPDVVFGEPEVVRIKPSGEVVIAEGANLDDAARAFWNAITEWRGDGSRPTLADVQPGGRVRLGDGLPPMPTCHDRQPDDMPGHMESALDWARDPDNCDAVEWLMEHHRAIRAALSAQPSPGGQDASDYWPEVDRILVDAYTTGSEGDEFDMIAARNAIRAAIAARQPVDAVKRNCPPPSWMFPEDERPPTPVGWSDTDWIAHLETAAQPSPAMCKEGLQVQPSLGGQGQARAREFLAASLASAGRKKGAEAVMAGDLYADTRIALRAIEAALAARQPVGEPVAVVVPGAPTRCRHCESTDLEWFAHVRAVNDVPHGRLTTHDVGCVFVLGCNECSETVHTVKADSIASLLAAPPAQAVDLGQFRPAVCAMGLYAEEPEDVDEAKRLMALIDSQAVGNG